MSDLLKFMKHNSWLLFYFKTTLVALFIFPHNFDFRAHLFCLSSQHFSFVISAPWSSSSLLVYLTGSQSAAIKPCSMKISRGQYTAIDLSAHDCMWRDIHIKKIKSKLNVSVSKHRMKQIKIFSIFIRIKNSVQFILHILLHLNTSTYLQQLPKHSAYTECNWYIYYFEPFKL